MGVVGSTGGGQVNVDVAPLEGLPSSSPLFVHAGIRRLRDRWGLSTAEASALLLEKLLERDPDLLFVPSFTYSFTQTGEYSRLRSTSEVGGFSEHVRRSHGPALRTLDPVFSCIDVLDSGFSRQGINREAFGSGSVWHLWDSLDGLIVNVGLDDVIATQVHYIESLAQVPYRYSKDFAGRVIDEVTGDTEHVVYSYQVRDLDEDPRMDFERRRALLERAGVLHTFSWEGVEVVFISARELRSSILEALGDDPRALLKVSSRWDGA